MTRSRITLFFASLALLVMANCSGSVDHDDAARAFPFVRLAPSAPPVAPYEEEQRSPQPTGEVWRKGYWDYDGKEFIWVSGSFISRPDPTAAWTPDRWEQRAFGWAFIPGYWQ